MHEHGIEHIALLHCDTQGAELEALQGSEQTIGVGRLRFACISTHHHAISGDPDIHGRCLDWLCERGAHVIAEHSVWESFSGDGLIVVSFDHQDRDLVIPMSYNCPSTSLFRTPERDLAALMRHVDRHVDNALPPSLR